MYFSLDHLCNACTLCYKSYRTTVLSLVFRPHISSISKGQTSNQITISIISFPIRENAAGAWSLISQSLKHVETSTSKTSAVHLKSFVLFVCLFWWDSFKMALLPVVHQKGHSSLNTSQPAFSATGTEEATDNIKHELTMLKKKYKKKKKKKRLRLHKQSPYCCIYLIVSSKRISLEYTPEIYGGREAEIAEICE